MSKLCTDLKEYVTALREILQNCQYDEEMVKEAEKRWGGRKDPRFSVFRDTLVCISSKLPDSTVGDNGPGRNELPLPPTPSTSTLRPYLTKYIADIREILQVCKDKEEAEIDDAEIVEMAKKRWGDEDQRFLVFVNLL